GTLPASLLMMSKMDVARSSDVALKPVNTLATESEMMGLSVSPLSPVKILLATSERGGASERNFPADLLMLSEIDEARFSGIVLKPVNILATESETVGLSVSALNPVKTLPR